MHTIKKKQNLQKQKKKKKKPETKQQKTQIDEIKELLDPPLKLLKFLIFNVILSRQVAEFFLHLIPLLLRYEG